MDKNEYRIMFEQENSYWWYRGLHELVELNLQRYSSYETLNILDAGCGTGRMMEILNRYGSVTGFEQSPIAISFCEQRNLKNIVKQDLNTWTPQSELYDVIVCNDVLSNSGIDDDLAVVSKFRSALKSGGHLLINLPAFECLRRIHDGAVSTQRRYRKRRLISELEDIGFVCSQASYRLPLLFVLILIRKYSIEKLRKKSMVTSDFIQISPFLNTILFYLLRVENRMLTAGCSFFFGSSLFLVCQKK